MDDRELIESFVDNSSQRGFGETLHIEGDVIIFDGYWHACLRVGPNTFVVRAEETPVESDILAQMAAVLADRGLAHVATDLPGITVLTMNKASLGFVSWNVWAADLETGQSELARAVTEDSFFENAEYYNPTAETDYTAELHGARRLAGLPTSVILSVGVAQDELDGLEAALGDCVVVPKRFGEIEPDACGSLVPTLILVEASEQVGREFVMGLRAASCSRVLPVVAVTPGAVPPLGADAAVGAGDDPANWAPPIRKLLP
ncbi:MAG: hypothetical protein AB1673_07060 [Actinomycetota bacterium]